MFSAAEETFSEFLSSSSNAMSRPLAQWSPACSLSMHCQWPFVMGAQCLVSLGNYPPYQSGHAQGQRGLPLRTSAKISDFLTPPDCKFTQPPSFFSMSAFEGTPLSADVINGSPLSLGNYPPYQSGHAQGQRPKKKRKIRG